MLLSLAPMEGITGYVFRNVHHAFFGRWTDRYYTPFVVCTYTKRIKTREKWDVLPENNKGPQLLSNKAEEFLFTARTMAELGYREVNLNLGCPVGTVTAKKKGSGFLTVPDELDRFLNAVFEGAEKIPVTKKDGSTGPLAISVKTRLGFTDVQEAPLPSPSRQDLALPMSRRRTGSLQSMRSTPSPISSSTQEPGRSSTRDSRSCPPS